MSLCWALFSSIFELRLHISSSHLYAWRWISRYLPSWGGHAVPWTLLWAVVLESVRFMRSEVRQVLAAILCRCRCFSVGHPQSTDRWSISLTSYLQLSAFSFQHGPCRPTYVVRWWSDNCTSTQYSPWHGWPRAPQPYSFWLNQCITWL